MPLQTRGLTVFALLANFMESADFGPYQKLLPVWGVLVSWGLALQFAAVATLPWLYGSVLPAARSAFPPPMVPRHGLLPNSAA